MSSKSKREALLDRPSLAKLCADHGFHPTTRKIDISLVPAPLHDFLPYAEIWGLEDVDDQYRAVERTPAQLRKHVVSAVFGSDKYLELSAWLGGEKWEDLCLDEGYVAFSSLVQCVETMEGMQ